MSDKPMIGMAPFYAMLYPYLRVRARELGYALGLHGSLSKDMDIIAMPWDESAVDDRKLAEELAKVVGSKLTLAAARWSQAEDKFVAIEVPGRKPHGRIVWTISLWSDVYIDLSVMPLSPGCPTN